MGAKSPVNRSRPEATSGNQSDAFDPRATLVSSLTRQRPTAMSACFASSWTPKHLKVYAQTARALAPLSLAFQHAKTVELALSGSTSEAAGSPVGTFRTADGFLSLNARRDPDFRRLCEALGNTWFSDERFASPAARLEHNAELSDLLASIIQKKSTAEWTAALSEADVLHAPVKTYQDLLTDEQVNALGVIRWDELEGLGRHPVVSVPGLATSGERGAPRIGEHNEAVLSDLGYPRSKIDDLRESGAIA